MTTGKKLGIAGVVVSGVTAYMAYVGAAASWQYYATADECLTQAPALAGRRIRVSGKIVAGTLEIAADRQRAEFLLAGTEGRLPVVATGTLPDRLAESMDVVVEGRLESPALLRGDKIITKCASKYASSPAAEVAAQPPSPTEPRR
jgi:cytochrome c-type biogenesis protein CcmE